jgi:hypothetical protein
MKGSFHGWFVGLVVPVQEIFVLSWLLYSAQYKIFFSSPYTFSMPLSPSPSKLGMQSCWVACLLLCFCGVKESKCKKNGGSSAIHKIAANQCKPLFVSTILLDLVEPRSISYQLAAREQPDYYIAMSISTCLTAAFLIADQLAARKQPSC